MIEVDVITRLADADALAPAWRDLLARVPERAATPTKTPLWCLTWWRVFGPIGGRSLRIVTVRDGGRLVGVVPLLRRWALHRRAVPVRRLELIATGEDEADEICSDYVGIVAESGYETRIAESLVAALESGKLGAWDELRLPAMQRDDEASAALVAALNRARIRAEIEPFGACPYIALPNSWEAYLSALGSQSRYLVNRSIRELETWGGQDGYAITRATDDATYREGRRLLHALHGERWSTRGSMRGSTRGSNQEGHGVFERERFRRFHDLIMPKLLADPRDGSLDLTWLTVRNRPIAIAYSIVYAKRIYFYQSGRALDLPKGVRPGIALHALAIKRAIAEGMREYDFLNGDARYKTQLALASRDLVTMRAVAPTFRARLIDAGRVRIDRAAQLWRMRKESRPTFRAGMAEKRMTESGMAEKGMAGNGGARE